MFKFHVVFFIWMSPVIDHSHDVSVGQELIVFRPSMHLKSIFTPFFAEKVNLIL